MMTNVDRVLICLHATLLTRHLFRPAIELRHFLAGDMMAAMKTTVNKASVEDFLNGLGNAKRREDAFAILKMMKSVTAATRTDVGPEHRRL